VTHPGEHQDRPLARFMNGPWPIVVIIALALVLRLISLGGRPLWYDEAFTVLYAEKPLETMLNGTVTRLEGAAAEEHPLFSYLVLHYCMPRSPWRRC
jgi:hypothetical protein